LTSPMKRLALMAVLAAWMLPAGAAEDAACRTVRLADVGWSDIAAANGLASVVLEGLGYKPAMTLASIPVALAGMKNRQIDVFLGYWSPSMTPLVEPYVKAGEITVLATPTCMTRVSGLLPTSQSSRKTSAERSMASSRAAKAMR
jgi:glycine betaine/proline transport system substrate-binding protein